MNQKSDESHTQKLFCLKDITSQETNKIPAKNLQPNVKTRKKLR